MGAAMKKLITAAAILSILTGCASQERVDQAMQAQKPPTDNIKRSIINHAKESYYDPYSLRDVEISYSLQVPEDVSYQVVCVKANAKNRMGAYTGRKAVSFRLKNEAVISTWDEAPGCLDSRLKYIPFKELEKLQ
jgi:hypothetical protein